MSRAVAMTTLLVAVLVQGCARNLPRPSSAPIVPRPFQRVWVAGFVTGDSKGVDVNTTSVRLLRTELRERGFEVIEGTPLELRNEAVFDDTAYWRRNAEDYRASVIVTGSVRLKDAPPRITQRDGRGGVYFVEPGLFLESRIVLINGASGAAVASYRLSRQVRYGVGRRGAPLVMYLGMMDTLMPELVRVVTGQRPAPALRGRARALR